MGMTLPSRFEPIRYFRKDRLSATFLATDRRLGRNEVVVKMIGKARASSGIGSAVDTLLWYQGLRHSLIAEVLDSGYSRTGDLYYVRPHHGPSDFFSATAETSVGALVAAVDFLHSKGIIHGSIKPGNVLSSGTEFHLCDPWLGVSPAHEQKGLTEEDIRFTAPEVLAGGALTRDSDLYSVGAVLYRFFAGRDPFEDSDLESLKAKYTWASPRRLNSVSYVSREIADIVTNLLHRDPERRRGAFEALKAEFHLHETSASQSPVIGLAQQLGGTLSVVRGDSSLRAILVEAPSGFGKSRFVNELGNRISLGERATAVCEIKGQDSIRSLARSIVAVIDEFKLTVASACLDRMRSLAEEDSPQSLQTEEWNRDVMALLASVGQRMPLLLVIDDIDRANRKMTSLVESIVQQPLHVDFAILLTSRPGGVPAKTVRLLSRFLGTSFQNVNLRPLTGADSEAFVSFFTNDRDRQALAQQRGGGNPFFLEQYCRKPARVATPKPVRATLSSMIQRLPKREKSVADVLSVFRHATDWNVFPKVAGIPELELRESMRYLERIGLANAERPSICYPDARTLLEARLPRSRRMELHERSFHCLQEAGFESEILAEHAFQAGMYDSAAALYRELARQRFAAKDRGIAATYYGQVLECRRRSPAVPPLDDADTLKLAQGYAFRGERTASLRILKQLMDSKSVKEKAELLSDTYSTRASVLLEDSVSERIHLLKLAIRCLPPASSELFHRYRALVSALLSAGKSAEAETTLRDLETRCDSSEEIEQLQDMRSTVFMNQGNFKDAALCLMNRKFLWAAPGSVSNNLAVCVEHLGDLKKSREIQMRALREGELSGYLTVQISSLSNLGSMEAKLGNFVSAERFFGLAFKRLRELRLQYGERSIPNIAFVYGDAALYFIHKGDFHKAEQFIQKMNLNRNSHFLFDTHSGMLTRCQLELALGERKRASKTLEEVRRLDVGGEYAAIERLLTEVSLSEPSKPVCERLEDSVQICQRLGTVYQECQVLLALAVVRLSLGERLESNRAARRARRLAVKNNFKPLEAQALLRMGVSSKRNVEKDFCFRKVLNDAARMGLAPLIAECAFRMGSWRLTQGEFAEAAEYLSKSVSTTARLAESLGTSKRRNYLDLPNHREARALLSAAFERAKTRPTPSAELMDKEGSFFARLYRLDAAMNASPDFASGITILLETLKQSMGRRVVVAFGSSPEMTIHSLPPAATDELKRQVASTAAIAGNKTYITGDGTQLIRHMRVWIPILCLTHQGGIYVECSRGQIALDEREIEFLTLAAAVAAAALDRINGRASGIRASQAAEVHGIVGASQQVNEIQARIEIAATNSANVLIEGESGTGKELVAKAIHAASARMKAPFIPVDCGALPEELIEAELFGSKKGAYTGALADRSGLFEAADHGTIFLDEISNLGLVSQAKLLRVLQDREVRKIGSTTGRFVDVRVIAATNCNLEKLVREGKFRKDLLYRLKVLHIPLPPLRDRRGDIPLLATTFLERLNAANDTKKYFGSQATDKLTQHDYPGNVRELHNAVERAFYSTRSAVITQVEFLEGSTERASTYETENWFKDLTEGRQDFWSAVHDPYKRRDIPREKVVALVDYGLRATRGNYKAMAAKFQIPKEEYRRFMDFLRRNNCLLDFRPYRKDSGIIRI